MNSQLLETDARISRFSTAKRSDRLIDYFLCIYFLLGLGFAPFYHTWLIAFGLGGALLVVYYSVKTAFPASCLYQYVLSVLLGVFMAQFIYQWHGMYEIQFFAFIGSAILITYQKWTLQIPMLVFVLLYEVFGNRLQHTGLTAFDRVNGETGTIGFIAHILLTIVIYFVCGLCAYQLDKYKQLQVLQSLQLEELQEKTRNIAERQVRDSALEERNTILESITDAFFAVDRNWAITYWNKTAATILGKSKNEILGHNLWEVYPDSVGGAPYKKYHEALESNRTFHFEDHFAPLDKWFEISAYPSPAGLSVYFKDITERRASGILLAGSEKRYSELFQLSPLPMWVFDLDSLRFLDVNKAAISHYGYSYKEFLSMTIRQIRRQEDETALETTVAKYKRDSRFHRHGIYRHEKKNGELIQVDILSNPIRYKGKEAKVVIAQDVTERLNYIRSIEEQNEKLTAISWMQSHVIRAPLARIMGLVSMLKHSKEPAERDEIQGYLLLSADELDRVIREISDKTTIIPPKP